MCSFLFFSSLFLSLLPEVDIHKLWEALIGSAACDNGMTMS